MMQENGEQGELREWQGKRSREVLEVGIQACSSSVCPHERGETQMCRTSGLTLNEEWS